MFLSLNSPMKIYLILGLGFYMVKVLKHVKWGAFGPRKASKVVKFLHVRSLHCTHTYVCLSLLVPNIFDWLPHCCSYPELGPLNQTSLSLPHCGYWGYRFTMVTIKAISQNVELLGSILKELRSLPLSSMCTLWTLLLNLSIPDVPFPVLLSTIIRRSRFQAKPATLLIPIDFSFPFRGGGALRYSVPKWLLFLIYCGEWFSLTA